MPTHLWGVVISALDPAAQAAWWADALGWSYDVDTDGDGVVRNPDPDGPWLLFERVVDAKGPTKNRVHLDLAAQSISDQRAIVDRLVAVGARHTDIGQRDVPWVVLADPEGNEFCVLDPRERYSGHGTFASIVIDALDVEPLAAFWAAATGWKLATQLGTGRSLHRPGKSPPDIDVVQVADAKILKGRVHLDVFPAADGDRDVEVGRLRALGATPADVGQGPDVTWVVLADPEGNEFCVLAPRD